MAKEINYITFVLLLCCIANSILAQNSPEETKREGPTLKKSISLKLNSDFEFGSEKVLSINNTVYGDANPKSGYYYYLPSSYSLKWSPLDGSYDFQVRYSTLSTGSTGTKGRTTVSATLYPFIENFDLELARNQISKFLHNESIGNKNELKELAMMPLLKTEVNFSNLSVFGLTASDYIVRPPADPSDPVLITFTTSQIDEFMGMFFSNTGLFGEVIFYPEGKEMPQSIRVPFNLKINSASTYRKQELERSAWRSSGWINKTDFTLNLQNFHVLRKESDDYKIYTWKLNNTSVLPKARAEFESLTVPTWIDSDASIKKIWLDYTVKECPSCVKVVKDKIIPKINKGKQAVPITISNLNSREFTRAAKMLVLLKSYQTEPNGTFSKELKIEFGSDNKDDNTTLLYVADGEEPDFTYKLKFIMADGTIHDSQWIPSKERNLYIGKKQVQELIPFFKTKN